MHCFPVESLKEKSCEIRFKEKLPSSYLGSARQKSRHPTGTSSGYKENEE